MTARALVLGIVVSLVLLGAAGGLHVLAGAGGVEQRYRDAASLARQIQQISSQWSVEIARVRSDPLADFDSLAAFIPRMARLKKGLGDARGIPGMPERLASDIRAYLSALDAKEERVERFKTGYAVVRNSARYLPLAAANVTREARRRGQGGAGARRGSDPRGAPRRARRVSRPAAGARRRADPGGAAPHAPPG